MGKIIPSNGFLLFLIYLSETVMEQEFSEFAFDMVQTGH